MATSASPAALSITQTVTGAMGAMLNGNDGDAHSLLQSALTRTRADLAESTLPPLLKQVRRGMPFQIYSLPLNLNEPCDAHRSTCPGSLFSFYNAAIVAEELCTEMELFFSAELSAMILYNMGLVYHRLALQTGSTHNFSKAMKLYKVSGSIVASNDYDFTHDLTILKLALLVNMGHIYSNFLDQNGTNECADGINTLYHSVDVKALDPDTRQLFYDNMFLSQQPSKNLFGLAPAA